MELTPKQQALELINKSKNILLATHDKPDGDAVGSTLALYLVLNKLGKKATAVVVEPVSGRYQFLPKVDEFTPHLVAPRDFVISLDCANAQADKLAYNFQDGKLNIVITPKDGNFNPQDVSFAEGNFQFDLIIVLDAADWDQVGPLYANNVKLFQGVPVVNIDHHSSNDYYGTINLVDLTATATAEVLVGLIEALGPSLVDEDVATALLTGIISDTGSFQHSNTTPKSLTIAAQMVGLGARQQEIIKYLFKTKSLTTLKLWGKILSNIRLDEEHKFSWSTVPLTYFDETGAAKEETTGVIDELMTSVPGADVVVLLTEKEPRIISGSIRTKKGVNSAEIAALFGGGGHPGAAGFKLSDIELAAAEEIVTGKNREYQARKPKLTPEEEDAILEQPSPSEVVEATISPEAVPEANLPQEMAVGAENLDQTE
ncbi:MAG: DHH family phosphoesterase [Patescibacteria group bacterium]|jgi:phosphoesterase RecJ-like protein